MSELYSLDGQQVDYNRFLTPYNADEYGSLAARCMEDRPGEALGMQIPGGPDGEATAYALALEAARPNTFFETGASVSEWSVAISGILGSQPHEACAARAGREAVLDLFASDPDLVYHTARQATDAVNETVFGRLADAALRIRTSGLAAAQEPPANALVPLQHNEAGAPVAHAGRHVMVIDAVEGDRVLWDNKAAWEAGAPAYGANVAMYAGRAVALNNRVERLVGQSISEEDFTAAGAAILGATMQLLPKFDGKAPQIVRVPLQ